MWEIGIIRVSDRNILLIRCTRWKKGEGRDIGILLRGAVCGSGGGLSFVEGMLRDQVFGETFGYYFSKDGPGACISF